jgi:hypothetical protein
MVQNFEAFNERVTFNESPKRLSTKVTLSLKEWLSLKEFWLKDPATITQWVHRLLFAARNGLNWLFSIEKNEVLLFSGRKQQTFKVSFYFCWAWMRNKFVDQKNSCTYVYIWAFNFPREADSTKLLKLIEITMAMPINNDNHNAVLLCRNSSTTCM